MKIKSMSTTKLQQQLKNACIKSEDTGCWEWQGQISNSGHGRMMIRDRSNQINRVVSAETASYMAFLGEIPDQYLVKQKCGNRLCINPEHLELLEY